MSESYKKLIRTLRKLFEMDKADLDFGIYRIMNQKREDINKFLEQDLLPQVGDAFSGMMQGDKSELQEELEAAIEQAKEFDHPNPEKAKPVLAIKKKMACTVDIAEVEHEVYSHLHTFFSRYYDKGDFISLRRYKKDTYAIPYEGEEVKLHWANSDQYYIKSSEYLRDYAFNVRTDDDRSVRIKLLEADTEKDNSKSQNGERRFVLDGENPLQVIDGELHIHFNYILQPKKTKQEKLNQKAVEIIFAQQDFDEWLTVLQQKVPTKKNPDRTLLEKHLNDYTARNTFDYFIHKDLGGFLRRELDFYIKNEVLFLDDIDSGPADVAEQVLRKIKVIRIIAHKIITLLAQLEDFQKKLWLKKKFVVETNYCVTLDLVPEELYEEIIACDEQWQEWVKLGFLTTGTSEKKEEVLGLGKHLVLDTRFYGEKVKDTLIASFNNLDEQCNGFLINSENFQALQLLQKCYEKKIKCNYIDPPYNTDSTPILYKNGYKHSSWASLLNDRVSLAKPLLKHDGIKTVAIDDTEMLNLSKILATVYNEYRLSRVTVVHNPKGSITKDFNRVHEYAIFLAPKKEKHCVARTLEENDVPRKMRRWGENSLRIDRRLSFYPIYVKNGEIVRIGEIPKDEFHPEGRNVILETGETEIWPVDQNGIERRWNFGLDSIESNLNRIIIQEIDDTLDLFLSHELTVPKTVWQGGDYDAGNHGNTLLINILGKKLFDFPKSIKLVQRCVNLSTSEQKKGVVLDYFAGSGTTGHAVINLNRKDHGNRKYILVEMGQYFNTVTKPRIQKVIFSKNWKNGKPKPDKDNNLNGISHCFKYLRLESYEDTLNNLKVKKPNTKQQSILDANPELKEDYMLSYCMDMETKGSASLLNLDQFENPFDYKLNIATDSVGVTKPTRIDLVETFNYLLGLTVKQIKTIDNFKIVIGENPKEESVLVVWRVLAEKDNAALELFMEKQQFHPKDTKFEHIYVNGDHTLEDPHSKVKLTEIAFKHLMFDVQDV